MTSHNSKVQCKAKVSNGVRCKNNAIPGKKYCYVKAHGADNETLYRRFWNWIDNHPLVKRFFWGISLVSISIAVFNLYNYFQDKHKRATVGIINAPDKVTLPIISLGGARFLISSLDGAVLKDGNETLLTVKITDKKMLVTTVIKNKDNEIVAELKNNEWEVNKEKYYQRNYTDEALEVIDHSGKVVLQVVRFDDTMYISGVFRCMDGGTRTFTPGQGGGYIDVRPKGVEPKLSIQKIFNYPSDLHFGECPGLETLRKMVNESRGGALYRITALDLCKPQSKPQQ